MVSLPVSDGSSARYEAAKARLNIKHDLNGSEDAFRAYWLSILPLYFNRAPSESELSILASKTFSKQGASLSLGVVWPEQMQAMDLDVIPLLFVQGEVDLRLPDDNLIRLKSLFSRAVFVELPGVGHFPMLEASADFLRALKKFVDDEEVFK